MAQVPNHQTAAPLLPTASEAVPASSTNQPETSTTTGATISRQKRPASATDLTTCHSPIQQMPSTAVNAPNLTTAAPGASSLSYTTPSHSNAHPPPPGLRADQPGQASAHLPHPPPPVATQLPIQAIAFTAMNAQPHPTSQPSAKRRKVNNTRSNNNTKLGRPPKQQVQQIRPPLAPRILPALKPAPPRPTQIFTPEPTPPKPPQPRMSFYSLPPELREEIYKLALGSLRIHILPLASDHARCQHPLTLTSRQIRSEVLPLIHKTRPIQANITDFNFDGLLAWLSRIPVNEPKDTLCKNPDLRIYLSSSIPAKEKPGKFESMRKWMHDRADPCRFQPAWVYAGPVAASRTATELRRRVTRQTDVRVKAELMKLASAVGVSRLDQAKKRGPKKIMAGGGGGERDAAAELVEAMDAAGEGGEEVDERESTEEADEGRAGGLQRRDNSYSNRGSAMNDSRSNFAASRDPPRSVIDPAMEDPEASRAMNSPAVIGPVVGFRPAENFVAVNTGSQNSHHQTPSESAQDDAAVRPAKAPSAVDVAEHSRAPTAVMEENASASVWGERVAQTSSSAGNNVGRVTTEAVAIADAQAEYSAPINADARDGTDIELRDAR
ncbi:hypothetical protein MBLNU230_g7676t1 [Neophaeotheca triangularis]